MKKRLIEEKGRARKLKSRRKQEEVLRENEERFRKVFDEGPLGMALVQPDHHFTRVNKTFCTMLGYSEEELTTLKFTEITHPDDIKLGVELTQKLYRGEIPSFSVEKRYMKKNGEVLQARLTASLFRDMKGHPVYSIAMIEDITERKKVDEALKESEEKYRTLVEQSLQGIMIGQGFPPRVVFVNPAMAKMLGYTHEELTSLSPKEIEASVYPEDRVAFFDRFSDRLQGEPPPSNFEFRAIRKDGEIRWMEVSANRIEYQGQPAVQATFIDIDERKRAEEALRESEERFRRITENMMDMVTQTDVQGICQYASPSFKTILGYEPKFMLGKSLFELVHPDDLNSTLEIALKALATRSTAKFDYRYKHADGHYVWLQSVGNPLFDLTGQISGTVLVTRDITERIEYETRLQALHTHASQLSSTKDIDAVVNHTLDAIDAYTWIRTRRLPASRERCITNEGKERYSRNLLSAAIEWARVDGQSCKHENDAQNTRHTKRTRLCRPQRVRLDGTSDRPFGTDRARGYRRRSGSSPMRRQHANRQLQRRRSETSRNISDTRRVSASTLETRRGA